MGDQRRWQLGFHYWVTVIFHCGQYFCFLFVLWGDEIVLTRYLNFASFYSHPLCFQGSLRFLFNLCAWQCNIWVTRLQNKCFCFKPQLFYLNLQWHIWIMCFWMNSLLRFPSGSLFKVPLWIWITQRSGLYQTVTSSSSPPQRWNPCCLLFGNHQHLCKASVLFSVSSPPKIQSPWG